MVKTLTHPGLLANLVNFYPSVCTIQRVNRAADSFGGQTETWVTFIANIPCAVAAMPGRELKLPDETYVLDPYRIALAGYYPQVTEVMRALNANGVVYDILSVTSDSQQKATYLICQVVK